jgi:hypothetical protein
MFLANKWLFQNFYHTFFVSMYVAVCTICSNQLVISWCKHTCAINEYHQVQYMIRWVKGAKPGKELFNKN